jgi:hypothetical protein
MELFKSGSGGGIAGIGSMAQNNPLRAEKASPRPLRGALERRWTYFGGAGVKPSRLWAGSGFGLGLGAFLTSFLPLSLLPMCASVPQKGVLGED